MASPVDDRFLKYSDGIGISCGDARNKLAIETIDRIRWRAALMLSCWMG